MRSLRLNVRPGRQTAGGAFEQLAGGNGITAAVGLILAQKHLVRGMRGIRLVLIDPRRCRVHVVVNIVGCAEHVIGAGVHGDIRRPRQHHEVGMAPFDIKRIIRHQRNVDRTIAPLGSQVQPMIEELAEHRHP